MRKIQTYESINNAREPKYVLMVTREHEKSKEKCNLYFESLFTKETQNYDTGLGIRTMGEGKGEITHYHYIN